jgi:hypothetical protein
VPKVVLVALLLVWLAWRTLAGTFELLGEFGDVTTWLVPSLTWTEDERIARSLVARDHKLGVPPGYHHELYRAVIEHVPPEGALLFDLRTGLERVKSVVHLGTLAFPRRILRNRAQPDPDWKLPPSTCVLTFGDALDVELEGRLRRLASGPDWTLWGP